MLLNFSANVTNPTLKTSHKIPTFTTDYTLKRKMSVYHTPVLLEESIELLGIKADGVYVDLTFGGGGHSRRILSALDAAGKLFAFDQDNEARANIPDDPRLTFVRSNFRFMRAQLRLLGIREADGILATVIT